jgi:hypothetical protein
MLRGRYLVSGGWTNYVYSRPEYGETTNELYFGVTRAGLLNPSIRLFQDLQAGSGAYVSLGASHTVGVWQNITATPGVALGYNHRQFIPESTFSDVNLGVRFDVPTPVERLSIVPFVNFSRALNRALFRDQFYGGIGVAVK